MTVIVAYLDDGVTCRRHWPTVGGGDGGWCGGWVVVVVSGGGD